MASREEDVRKPKPKKNSKNIQRDAPFPVPIASLTGKSANLSRWYHYFGTLKGDSVVVSGLGDMTFLYKMVKEGLYYNQVIIKFHLFCFLFRF